MIKLKNLILPIFLILVIGCKKDEVNVSKLRIDLYPGAGAAAIASNSSIGIVFNEFILYQSFNKNDYKGCKSIILSASLKSFTADNNCYLEIYDLTNNKVISKSTIATNSIDLKWINSDNLLSEFPDSDIDISLRLRTEKENVYVQCLAACLYIEY
jgi:hypothetical protein